MIPLALGTQTTASLNRPAAYCGIAAFKPSTRSIPSFGVAPLASSYDTVGFYGGQVADAVFAYRAVQPAFIALGASKADSPYNVILLDDPLLGDAADASYAAWQAMSDRIQASGVNIIRKSSPIAFERVRQLHWQTQIFEMAHTRRGLLDLPQGQIGDRLRETLVEGLTISEVDYLDMRGQLDQLRAEFSDACAPDQLFLWPATPTTAPRGLESTGDPRYIAPWTALGGPMVTIPAGRGENGLPLGCILCGLPGRDAELAAASIQLAESCEDSPLA